MLAIECQYLPDIGGIFIITCAFNCLRLPTLARDYQHLLETAGICLIILLYLISARERLHLPVNAGTYWRQLDFAGVQWRLTGPIMCVGSWQTLPTSARDYWHTP